MTKEKCSFTNQAMAFIDGKRKGKSNAALLEHAASCPVCGPLLAAAMKTMDDERLGKQALISPVLQESVMELALQELNRNAPVRSKEARPWFFNVPYYAAAACVLLLAILFFTPRTNPWDKPSPLDPGVRRILIGLKGGANNEFKDDFGKYCYQLGNMVERLYYFRDSGGSANRKMNKSYQALLASLKSVFSDEMSGMALGLNKLPGSLEEEDPTAFPTKMENLRISIEAICRGSGIKDWNWFYTLGRANGALVNFGYAPSLDETYSFPHIINTTPPNDAPYRVKLTFERLQSHTGKRIDRNTAKKLYNELSYAEKGYIK